MTRPADTARTPLTQDAGMRLRSGAASARASQTRTATPPASSRQPVQDYLDRSHDAEFKRGRGDISNILQNTRSLHSPGERGVVGPTGASSIVNSSILGPPFALWGGVAGYRIITGARSAGTYLRSLSQRIDTLDAELQALRDHAKGVAVPETIALLEERRQALADFRSDVVQAAREQRFNETVPGYIQLGASSGILAVSINSIPTLGHGSTLIGTAGTMALGVVSGGALCVYGGLSLARSLFMSLKAWARPKRDIQASLPRQQRDYLKAYNDRVGLNRLFHSLNSVSWAGFVAGCGCMVSIAAGAALSHGAVIAAVVITALSVVVWDALWGERCAPRTAMTPHIDRNDLGSLDERAELWALLDRQGDAKAHVKQALLETLPKDSRWLTPKQRYAYIWRFLPRFGGSIHVAKWADRADVKAVRPVLLNYLTTHMAGEEKFFASKLRRHVSMANRRAEETARLEEPSEQVALALKTCGEYDEAIGRELAARYKAVKSLHDELRTLTERVGAGQACDDKQFNRLVASFIAVNEMENEVFTGRDTDKHEARFQAIMGKKRWRQKPRVAHIMLRPEGITELEHEGLSAKQRRRFIHAVMSNRQRQYELDALFNIEASYAINESVAAPASWAPQVAGAR